MNNDDEKRIQNLFKTLQKDSKSVFYVNTNISKNHLKKLNKIKIKILIKTLIRYH